MAGLLALALQVLQMATRTRPKAWPQVRVGRKSEKPSKYLQAPLHAGEDGHHTASAMPLSKSPYTMSSVFTITLSTFKSLNYLMGWLNAMNAGISVHTANAAISVHTANAAISVHTVNAGISVYTANAGISVHTVNAGISVHTANAAISVHIVSLTELTLPSTPEFRPICTGIAGLSHGGEEGLCSCGGHSTSLQ